MFENQIEEEEEKEVIFKREGDNKEYWCALRKHLVIDQFQLQELQTKSMLFFRMLCKGASFAKALISIYRAMGLI